MLHGNFLSSLYHINFTFFMFPLGMRTYHEGMHDILHASSEIVSKLSNWKVNNFLKKSITLHHDFSFCSLVTKDDLLDQYPNAGNLIDVLPALSTAGCKFFKPEAHLLIEKFLSLKKESSRSSFIANMVNHTIVRRKVSNTFKFRGTLRHFLLVNAQSFL